MLERLNDREHCKAAEKQKRSHCAAENTNEKLFGSVCHHNLHSAAVGRQKIFLKIKKILKKFAEIRFL